MSLELREEIKEYLQTPFISLNQETAMIGRNPGQPSEFALLGYVLTNMEYPSRKCFEGNEVEGYELARRAEIVEPLYGDDNLDASEKLLLLYKSLGVGANAEAKATRNLSLSQRVELAEELYLSKKGYWPKFADESLDYLGD